MELKLAEDEKKQGNGGLKLSDKVYHEDESRLNDSNPWDFGLESPPVYSTSISSTTNMESQISDTQGNTPVLVITKIILYLLFALEAIAVIWCLTQSKADIGVDLAKVQWIFNVTSIFCLIDAILVNVLYERKISLIVWALFFPFVYPGRRNKHVDGSGGIGTLICLSMLLCYAGVFSTVFSAVSTYGNVLFIADDTTRNAVVELLDQTAEDGRKLGMRLNQNMNIDSAEVQTDHSSSSVVIIGNGRHYVDDTGNIIEMNTKTIPTQLLFVKDSKGIYQLSDVILDSTRLGTRYREFYNNNIIYR